MVKRIWMPLLACTLLVATAQAKERVFTPIPGDGQEVRFYDGEAILVTGTRSANLAVSFVPLNRKSALLSVWVENASDGQFNISENSVAASSGGVPLRVLTYADRVKAQKRKQAWAAFATGLAAGLNSYAASNAGTSTYSSTSSYGNYYATSYNAGVAYLAQANAAAQNEAMFERYQAAAAQSAKNLQAAALKANTLTPGQSVMGDVQMYLPQSVKKGLTEFDVNVNLAGEVVTIRFREGLHAVDTNPRPYVVEVPNHPMADVGVGTTQARVTQTPSAAVEAGRASAAAFAHPSGSAARVELTRTGCLEGFAILSSNRGRTIFESTCPDGKRQLVECQGMSCKQLN